MTNPLQHDDFPIALISLPLILFGSAFLIYCIRRVGFFALLNGMKNFGKESGETGRGIDLAAVSDRVQHLREDLKEKNPLGIKSDFKHTLRVQSRREQIAKMNFFQTPRPQPSEPSEHEHGVDVILI